MIVDFTDPASVRAWMAVCPPRHRAQLAAPARLPLFKPMLDALFDAQRAQRKET